MGNGNGKGQLGNLVAGIAGFASTVVAAYYLPQSLFIPLGKSIKGNTIYTNVLPLGVGATAKVVAYKKPSAKYVNSFGDGAIIAGVGLPVFAAFFL